MKKEKDMNMKKGIMAAGIFVVAASVTLAQASSGIKSQEQNPPVTVGEFCMGNMPQPPGGMSHERGMPPSGGPGRLNPMMQNGPMGNDPFKDSIFPPELIVQNQQALGLSDEQKSAIREIMKKSMVQFTDLLWQQGVEQEIMASLMKLEKVDEAKAIAQLDKLLNIEHEIKRLFLCTMLKVKNMLSAEQQLKIRALMRGPQETRKQDPREMHGGEQPPSPPTSK